jgi:hypothetical protein
MAKPRNTIPQTRKPESPVRLPQRSEDVSGDERQGQGPIAAAGQTGKQPKRGVRPPANRRRPPAA